MGRKVSVTLTDEQFVGGRRAEVVSGGTETAPVLFRETVFNGWNTGTSIDVSQTPAPLTGPAGD